jgi:4,5-DOPA dioxygenase extradiol
LDHGTWAVLRRMFPDAKIPVVQLSIDYTREPQYHYELAQELKRLRNKGILIIGSGNIVHNLGTAQFEDIAFDWALEFDQKIKDLVLADQHEQIVHYEKLGAAARLSIPTNDHYLPLLYTLGLKDAQDQIKFFADRVTGGSISMRSVWLG